MAEPDLSKLESEEEEPFSLKEATLSLVEQAKRACRRGQPKEIKRMCNDITVAVLADAMNKDGSYNVKFELRDALETCETYKTEEEKKACRETAQMLKISIEMAPMLDSIERLFGSQLRDGGGLPRFG